MKKKLLLSLVGLCVCLATWAQLPTKGKYYRIYSSYGTVIKENWREGALACVNLMMDDYSQVWQYTSSGALQNVFTGKYIQPQPTNSVQFRTGTTQHTANFAVVDGNELTIIINGNPLHCASSQGNIVVRWGADAGASHWTLEEISMTSDMVQKARDEYNALANLTNNAEQYTQTLLTFFTSELCTELKESYAAMSDADLKAAMNEAGLPVVLQDIAVKVKNEWWNETESSEFADKNKYAKEFRVAKYKPYSDARNWQNKLQWNGASYMGNPTGIYAQNKDIIHVFVGSDIPEGATLYLTPVRNQGLIRNRTEGTELKKGYNAIVADTDSLVYFINYVVNTIDPAYWGSNNWNRTDPAGATTKKLSDYPELDIHIEGGDCVGFYQKPKENSPEEDAKYQYLTQNACPKMFFMVKGETTVFYFRRETYTDFKHKDAEKNWGETIFNSIDWFDRVQYWELGLIGVTDNVANGLCESGTEHSKSLHEFNIKGGDAFYPTYCNNPSMALQVEDGKNPHASQFYTGYPGMGGVESSFNADRIFFDPWCCGHEHGHSIQHAYNLESCAESSVNLGSQVITYMSGLRMSRGWTFDQNYAYVKDGVQFGQRDISITMRMYWNLYVYYHIAGRKKDFYPTFVKMLREDPMDFSQDGSRYNEQWDKNAGHHRATTTWIKFYKLACEAAQEDLTEYFRLWGFFEPCNWMWFGDYANYWVSLTQKEIDEAIAEVKAKGYKENLQIMFIEDRLKLRERTDIYAHTATGSQKYKTENHGSWRTQEQLNEEFGDVGDVLTFIDGSANTSDYKYIQTANHIKMTGKGGVGFIVYDKNGKNSYMSNRFEFDIPVELAKDSFTIKIINADGTSSVAKDASLEATDEELLAILQTAITATEQYTRIEDESGKKVGFYNSNDLAALKGLVSDAEAAIEATNVANYSTLAKGINNEILRILSEDLMQKIEVNSLYTISSLRKVSGGSRNIAANNSGQLAGATASSNPSRWAFIPTSEEDENVFYLQNRNTGEMIGVTKNEKGGVTGFEMVKADPELAAPFTIKSLENGVMGLRPLDNTYVNIAPAGGITVWHAADEGSQWYITEIDTFQNITEEQLESAIATTEELVNKVSDYTVEKTKYELQCTKNSAANYLSTNQPDPNRPNNSLDKAIDGKNNTFFMSKQNSNATEPHHLMVDLGSGKNSKSIQFTLYGNISSNYATAVNIYGSNNARTWIALKQIEGMRTAYESDVISQTASYRYFRFDVVATEGRVTDNSEFPWFTVKEFELYEADAKITMKEGYEDISRTYVNNCRNNVSEAQEVLKQEYKTSLGNFVAWEKLNAAYEALFEKASEVDPTVDINDIDADGAAEGEVYDLSGRKLNGTNGSGVYIIGGKKVIK